MKFLAKKETRENLSVFLKGFLMGCADIVPGVSGGTIALITGIYQRLIDGIRTFFDFFIWLFSRKGISSLLKLNKNKIMKEFRKIDFIFFSLLLAGIFLAIFLASNIIKHLIVNQPIATYSFFSGLILGSAAMLFISIQKKLRKIKLLPTAILLFGAGISFIIAGISSGISESSRLMTFFSGFVGISAMILPGISGAFILMLLGQYEYIIDVIRTLNIPEIAIFSVGALTGLLILSRFLSYLLHKYENMTKSFLVGLMLGSLRYQTTIIREQGQIETNLFSVGLFLLIGISLVFGLFKISQKKSLSQERTQ
ncbi:MAG: DUF368 domain-containing protein [Nanoarchaeota archaeon]